MGTRAGGFTGRLRVLGRSNRAWERHFRKKALIDGMPWQAWLPHSLGRPLETALELGCGSGAQVASLMRVPAAREAVGIDLDETHFQAAAELLGEAAKRVRFVAADINQIRRKSPRTTWYMHTRRSTISRTPNTFLPRSTGRSGRVDFASSKSVSDRRGSNGRKLAEG